MVNDVLILYSRDGKPIIYWYRVHELWNIIGRLQ